MARLLSKLSSRIESSLNERISVILDESHQSVIIISFPTENKTLIAASMYMYIYIYI